MLSWTRIKGCFSSSYIYLLDFLLKKIQALSWLCKKTAKLTTHLKTEWGCSDLFRWYDENRDYGENGMFSKK